MKTFEVLEFVCVKSEKLCVCGVLEIELDPGLRLKLVFYGDRGGDSELACLFTYNFCLYFLNLIIKVLIGQKARINSIFSLTFLNFLMLILSIHRIQLNLRLLPAKIFLCLNFNKQIPFILFQICYSLFWYFNSIFLCKLIG